MTVRTLAQAAAWVDRIGLALVFPKDDVVLPSLWEAAGGSDEHAERAPDGTFLRWSPPMQFVWTTKDELPGEGYCVAGKHLRGRASLASLDVLPALVVLARSEEPAGLEAEVVEILHDHGPTSTRDLPDLLPHHERKRVRVALDRLQKQLVVTNAGLEETDGWPAIVVDLVDRRFADRLHTLPARDAARRTLARRVLAAVGELTAEDLRGALGWRKADCVAALESLGAPARDEGGFTIWAAAGWR